MRRRFFLSIAAGDIASLAIATAIGSLVVFSTPLVWRAPSCAVSTVQPIDCVPAGESIIPLVGLLAAGALLGSWGSRRLWASGVPRPSYGRAVGIVSVALTLTAFGIVFGRMYFSRGFLAVSAVAWLGGSLLHRAVRRRRPWTEQMVLVTAEKGLADDIRSAPHAGVLQVFDPEGTPPTAAVPEGATLVVDLRSVLSDRMA